MSAHQKPDGRWFVVWLENGRQRTRHFGRGPESEQLAREFDSTIPRRTYQHTTPKPGSIRFDELANAYAESRVGIMEKTSLDNWLWKMHGIVCPVIGHLRAMEITSSRLDRYVKDRLAAPKNRRKPDGDRIKRTTVHRELSDIRAVLNWGARRRYIPFNPAAAYEMPKRDDEIILPPTTAEASALLQHSPEHLARAVVLSYYLGLRPGVRELFSITWSDVDLVAGMISIRSARKGGARLRVIPIHRGLSRMLKAWKKADKANGRAPGAEIVHYNGQAVASVKKAFITAKKRAGIMRRMPLYSLRHAFATETLRAHGDLKTVSTLLGHTRVDTTTRIYQHLNEDMARDAVEKLPGLTGVGQWSMNGKKASRKKLK